MAFDFKKEYKQFYLPPQKPEIIDVPMMRFAAVRGQGDPNRDDGEYKQALAVLYAVCYTIKMSKLGDHRMDGYFDFVVPPLEGLWWQEDAIGVDYSRKEDFRWVSMIRLPDFVSEAEFQWAKEEAAQKKKMDCGRAELLSMEEGSCVQIMHLGSYDDEPESIQRMDAYAAAQGYRLDFSETRRHHEIYLSDPRKTAPDKLRTVIRHPVAKQEG
ncbi:MAG: GyrI-like domain-containing protein [Clostridia bacterium]|nr:GyrI-like domain-containing protein [Clostridia bacterium]MBR0408639.1 GyrI-like domain-containing protein [Clostridia bacterium]